VPALVWGPDANRERTERSRFVPLKKRLALMEVGGTHHADEPGAKCFSPAGTLRSGSVTRPSPNVMNSGASGWWAAL